MLEKYLCHCQDFGQETIIKYMCLALEINKILEICRVKYAQLILNNILLLTRTT